MANTGGLKAAGAGGAIPIPTQTALGAGLGGTALGQIGTNFAGTIPANANADFNQIVTALVIRNIIENLRDKAVILQAGSFIHASHVPGTNQLRYTAFADLTAAEDLLEGVPPEPDGLQWDVQEFVGKQKGKLVAITDLAEDFSPFELYRIASEKIAWNAIDTAEKDAAKLIDGTTFGNGIAVTPVTGKPAESVVAAVVAMKKADVPSFPDGTYHVLINPTDAALIMTQTGELGWTDTMKYANGTVLLNGELGAFRGARFIETNRVAVQKSVIFGPDAFIWGDYQTVRAYRVAPGGDHADPLAQRGLVGWKAMWGMKTNEFDGTPPMGPTGNIKAQRFAVVNLVA